MIQITDVQDFGRYPKVYFRYFGADMVADLDTSKKPPLVIPGLAMGCDSDVDFCDYGKLQLAIQEWGRKNG